MSIRQVCAVLAIIVTVPVVVAAQLCSRGPADTIANGGLGASLAHWPWSTEVLEAAARATFADFGYEIASSTEHRFRTRPSVRRPDHPLLAVVPEGQHPGVVLALEIVRTGDSSATRLSAQAQCALDLPPETQAEDSYEFVLAEEFLTHLVVEARFRGMPGGVGYHILAPGGHEEYGPERDWCPYPDPPDLLRRGIGRAARLAFVVDARGHTVRESIEVLEATHTAFGQAGKDMVSRCEFVPAEVDGHPVRARLFMPISFDASPNR